MKLTVLGCGDAFGSGGRNHTSFLLSGKKEHVLIDCGATTLVRMKQEKISTSQISMIILTHFHGDHYGGLPFFLIDCIFNEERTAPLTIIGPMGVESRVHDLQENLYPSTWERVQNLNLYFIEYEEKKPIKAGELSIEAFEVDHSPPSNPHGIRIEWEGKVFSFSGDTGWTEALIPLSKGAHLFLCECNFWNEHIFGHLSYDELLENKDRLGCENIWLTHMGDQVLTAPDLQFNRLSDGMQVEF